MSSSSGSNCAGIDDYQLHITTLEDQIDHNTSDSEYVKDYRKSQLLQAQGLFEASLLCLQKAYAGVKPHRSEFLWRGLYFSIASLLASTYDYFSKFKETEDLYIELIQENPEGVYIGDYAIFLHRRKRDFDQAQR